MIHCDFLIGYLTSYLILEDESIGFFKEPLAIDTTSNNDSLRIVVFNEEQDLGYITKVIQDTSGMEKIAFINVMHIVKSVYENNEVYFDVHT